jgi:hypothetical protein
MIVVGHHILLKNLKRIGKKVRVKSIKTPKAIKNQNHIKRITSIRVKITARNAQKKETTVHLPLRNNRN